MASCKKFTNAAMCNELRHNNRKTAKPKNEDIDRKKSSLNYSFPMDHKGMSNYRYYKSLIDEKYLYGRGTERGKNAITGCGWVVTLPNEIYGFPEKEKAFFNGVYDFISERYGTENILNNAVHYDEAGLPHIHVVFCPSTTLDHDIVHHKTKRTSKAKKLESGRYEYEYRFVLDEKGEKIKINNYAKMTDYYSEKIDCNSVLNPIELKHFHSDLQEYLQKHGIEGRVIKGNTGGVNFTVEELKKFTEETGLRLDDVKELQGNKSLLESFVEKDSLLHQLEEALHQKNIQIESLQQDFTEKLSELKRALTDKQQELEKTQEKISELEKEQSEQTSTWGKSADGWGAKSQSSWGEVSQSSWNTTTEIEEEKTW